jgi:molybdopterin molybdotransferase
MRPLQEAQREVLAAVDRLPARRLPLGRARGLVLAEPVRAAADVPPFASSAMDGYAVRSADVADPPVELKVLEDVPAGRVATHEVAPGTAIKIMTGAPVPAGADAVVKVEDTSQLDDVVVINAAVARGTAIRPAGGDVAKGDLVLATGFRLGPEHIGVLANLGVAEPLVHSRPRVAVASTGDELVEVDGPPLGPGQIRDSNRPMLIAALEEAGAEVVDLGHVPDDEPALRRALARGAESADVVMTSGGVSMGEYDLVKALLSEMGSVSFWQVAMQPAKPFAFGRVEGRPFFGLPGNPVSSLVAFEQFVRPALLKMMGSEKLFRPRVGGRMAVEIETDPAKTVFVRVRIAWRDGERWAEPSGSQSSNVLSAVAAGDAFAVIPEGTGRVEAGGEVTLELFRVPEERRIDDL